MTPLMATAAKEKYHDGTNVNEVDHSNVPARRPLSPPLESDEVSNIHVILERVLDRHSDGYEPDLPGIWRLCRDFRATSFVRTVSPDSDGAGPRH